MAINDSARQFTQAFIRQAKDAGFGNGGMFVKCGFDFLAADILATTDDDVLLAIDDEQIAVLVKIADIAGTEISVVGHALCRCIWPVPIAGKERDGTDGDFAPLALRHGLSSKVPLCRMPKCVPGGRTVNPNRWR